MTLPRTLLSVLAASLFLSSSFSHSGDAVKPLKIIAFGTSLTSRSSWPDALESALQSCLKIPVSVEKLAKGGGTTFWALQHVEDLISENPQHVLLEIYANDASILSGVSLESSINNISSILDQITRALPDLRVTMMIMNPVRGPRRWIRPYLDDYTAAHKAIALKFGVPVLDFGPQWAGLTTSERKKLIPDGLHPEPAAADKIVTPELVKIFSPVGCR